MHDITLATALITRIATASNHTLAVAEQTKNAATAVADSLGRGVEITDPPAAPGEDLATLTTAIADLVQLARVADLPETAIAAALRGNRADALEALHPHAYRVITVEDSHSTRYYEVRSTLDNQFVAGFYDAGIARQTVRNLNAGVSPAAAIPVGDPIR
ncbi:hypothetical protein [Gordonia insulae]|uniref:Uncharacterized protein n=1 Tax=Gordonia insulae TaxID=2420509 RepID=A0A3G8JHN9_9ACTN|nr:hypothetical protein [Gordonia insulae]AZG44115.1 hypothetical protein D7316_00695 [Gordonia insulae]